MTTITPYAAAWSWTPINQEEEPASNFLYEDLSTRSEGLTQPCASPRSPTGCEVNPSVAIFEELSHGSLSEILCGSPTQSGDEHLALTATPKTLWGEPSPSSRFLRAEPIRTASQSNHPSPNNCTSKPETAPSSQDSAAQDECSLSLLSPSLINYVEGFQQFSRSSLEWDADPAFNFADLQWESTADPLLGDESFPDPPLGDVASVPNPPLGDVESVLDAPWEDRTQKQRLSTPEDDDVVLVDSVPRRRKRPHDLSSASDKSYPSKRPRLPVLLTEATQQCYDGDREYVYDRGTKSWKDKEDGTLLLDRFKDEGYKTLNLKVYPRGLSGMPVLLSWDEGEGMFCGYDIAGGFRLVGKDDVGQLIASGRKSQKLDWPDVDESL